MGIYLFGYPDEDRDMKLDGTSWNDIRELAVAFGWSPAGTFQPDDESWDGNYSYNNLQIVTRADARRMADALDTAVVRLTGTLGERWSLYRVREFIDFARGGAFVIS